MKETKQVFTLKQLNELAELRNEIWEYEVENSCRYRFPSKYDWVNELLNEEQVTGYYEHGFDFLSMNPREFDGITNTKLQKYTTALRNAWIRLTTPTFKGFVPDFEEMESWKCSCGDDAADPGMGCIACFVGVKDMIDEQDNFPEEEYGIEEEGPYGGAFRDEDDFINWREGSGFVKY